MNKSFRTATLPRGALPLKLALSVEEAAQALGIGRTLCYLLIKDGDLHVTKIHGRSVVQVSEIEDFMARRRGGGAR